VLTTKLRYRQGTSAGRGFLHWGSCNVHDSRVTSNTYYVRNSGKGKRGEEKCVSTILLHLYRVLLHGGTATSLSHSSTTCFLLWMYVSSTNLSSSLSLTTFLPFLCIFAEIRDTCKKCYIMYLNSYSSNLLSSSSNHSSLRSHSWLTAGKRKKNWSGNGIRK